MIGGSREVTRSSLKLPLVCQDTGMLSFCVCARVCKVVKHSVVIHILIQLGMSVIYLYAIDFLKLLGDGCFTLNVITGKACFSKQLCVPLQFLIMYSKMSS